ncbi:uncharacterized protein AKAME5_002959300, partial [Lates japonicus]
MQVQEVETEKKTQVDHVSESDSPESEACSYPGLDPEYCAPKDASSSGDEEDLTNLSEGESPTLTPESVQQMRRKQDEEVAEGSDLSSAKAGPDPCSEDGNSDEDDLSPGTSLAKKASQKRKLISRTKKMKAMGGGPDLFSLLKGRDPCSEDGNSDEDGSDLSSAKAGPDPCSEDGDSDEDG